MLTCLVMMEGYEDDSRLHSRLRDIRHTLDGANTPELGEPTPVPRRGEVTFATPPERDRSRPRGIPPPAYSDIDSHRTGATNGSPLARRLFESHSPTEDSHRPDANTLFMVVDQFRDRVQHLEGELLDSQQSVQVLQDLLRQREDEAKAREDELQAALARQARITDDQQVAFAQQLEAQGMEHRAQLAELVEEVKRIKVSQEEEDSLLQVDTGQDKLSKLRSEVVNFIPGTVNTRRGAACYESEDQPFRSMDGGNPVFKPERHVRFADDVPTSTPRKANLELSSIHPWTDGEDGEISRPVPAPRRSLLGRAGSSSKTSERSQTSSSVPVSGVDTSLVLASELKKFREPKIQALKGGYSADAALFFNTWARDVRSVVEERQLTDAEAVRLVKDKTESNALKEVHYYLEMCSDPSFEGVMAHLKTAYTSGEDGSTIASEFYSRIQRAKESEDVFADELQILARKMVHFRPSSRNDIETELKSQFANGLRDSYYGSLARSLLVQFRNRTFMEFRSELSKVFGGRGKKNKTTGVSANAVSTTGGSASTKLTKAEKKAQQKAKKEVQAATIKNLEAKLDAAIAQNKQYQELLQPETLQKVIANSVAAVPFARTSSGSSGKPFLGKPRAPSLHPGDDGSLDPNQECYYCKDKGHLIDNCSKLKAKKAAQAAQAASFKNPAQKEN